MSTNPYEVPKAEVNDPPVEQDVSGLISGQRMVIYAILAYIGANVLAIARPGMIPPEVLLGLIAVTALGSLILSFVGIARLATHLGYHPVLTILICLLMLVPCVGLIVLLVLNSAATSRIQAAGYKVGLLGART